MKKPLVVATLVMAISGCAGLLEKQAPICSGTALIGGQETTVQIYGIRHIANQTQYRAGEPFGWHWVSKTNFTSTTCAK
ncbi:MAG: cor protein [Rouxiella aceris]|uniref:phage exclusion lipoprotein Cor n=1 Tax=Rouxiella aceris TaxID=2703884 RepID=UPI002850D025|nr:cor protein [Rouxiella aceris]MDR3431034.1 cor protein [Rouxiella aceris]